VISSTSWACSRCGAPCEPWPGPRPLCNRCALELGQQEVAERRATGGPGKTLAIAARDRVAGSRASLAPRFKQNFAGKMTERDA